MKQRLPPGKSGLPNIGAKWLSPEDPAIGNMRSAKSVRRRWSFGTTDMW